MVTRGLLFMFGLFIAMFACMEIGRRAGHWRADRDTTNSGQGLGAVEGAIFGLLGLMLAFTFSGAASRFDMRRIQIIDEANAISTAYLRIDVLPEETRPALRQVFRDYVDARIAIYRAMPDVAATEAALARSTEMQRRIWDLAIHAGDIAPPGRPLIVVYTALTEMFDMAATRIATMRLHPPTIVYLLLATLLLTCSALGGYSLGINRQRSKIHAFGFVFILVLTVYIILDMEHPRLGFVRIGAFDDLLVQVRASMN